MALMAPDFTSCFACSVAVAVSTTGCSDSERLTPPWLAVLLLLCFFRASNAFFFFLSLLNFFCRASSSSLSPGGITNMVAPGSGAGPNKSFSTVTTQEPQAAHTGTQVHPARLAYAPASGHSLPSGLNQPSLPSQLLLVGGQSAFLPASKNHRHRGLGIPRWPRQEKENTPSLAETVVPDPPAPAGMSMASRGV